jgi:hypothetical protein
MRLYRNDADIEIENLHEFLAILFYTHTCKESNKMKITTNRLTMQFFLFALVDLCMAS